MLEASQEGQRIHRFIAVMKGCGCSFDSQVIPTFTASGAYEFWEGEFTYGRGGISVSCRLTLDHEFISLRTRVALPREEVRRYREELHFLLTANQVTYQFEPDPETAGHLLVRLTCFLYDTHAKPAHVRTLLDMMAQATRELSHARETGFRNYRPLIP